MKAYEVTIRAIITKTYTVKAKDEQQAIGLANEAFSVLNDDTDEDYDQDTLSVDEVEIPEELK